MSEIPSEQVQDDLAAKVSASPDTYMEWYEQGNVLASQHQYAEALAAYDLAIKIEPENPLAWNSRGNVLYSLQQYSKSLASYNKALDINPTYSSAWNGRGNALKKMYRHEEAFIAYKQALQIRPFYPEALNNKGNLLLHLQRYEDAMKAYDAALKINPHYVYAWNGRGNALYGLRRYEEAYTAYEEALKINPEYAYAWNGRGNTLKELHRLEAALYAYEEALKIKPDYPKAWHNKGNLLSDLQRYSQAIAAYESVLKTQPKYYPVWESLAQTLEKMQQYPEALAAYNKVIEIKPDSYKIWTERGDILYALGQNDEAIASFEKAIEIQPNDKWAWLRKGHLLEALNQYSEAIASYNKASEIADDASHYTITQTTAINRLGFKLFSEILQQDKTKSVLISPFSIAMALAMSYNGAGGQTAQAMAKVLEYKGRALQSINQAHEYLIETLINPDAFKVELIVANFLWAREEIPLHSKFVQQCQKLYKAEVKDFDFSNAAAPEIINAWMAQQSNGKIDQIIEGEINPLSSVLLINAIYFKGNFAEAKTKAGSFTLLDGTKREQPMMSQSGTYPYYRNELFQAISLPYGNGRLSMDIFLPTQEGDWQDFSDSLNAQNWERWLKKFRSQEGYIVLPHFRLEYDIELSDTLKALGMAIAFDKQQADFSGISSMAETGLDKVIHKCYVEVNSEGSEAAVETADLGGDIIGLDGNEFRMVCDRPFFCAIRDKETGTILFVGTLLT